MSLVFEHPKSNNSGSKLSVHCWSKVNEECSVSLFIEKQVLGEYPFDGGAKLGVKLKLEELMGFILAVDKKISLKRAMELKDDLQHGNKRITFDKYVKGKKTLGYALCFYSLEGDAIVESYKMGLNIRETKIFYEYLKFLMGHIFQAFYGEDRQAKEKKNDNKNKPKTEKAKLMEEYIPNDVAVAYEAETKPDPLDSFDAAKELEDTNFSGKEEKSLWNFVDEN